ncbi:MAG: hypothetical protein SV253_09135 [Halobacteria archaeon]|nr:hypothetical protein [Halobacteria archaeon]
MKTLRVTLNANGVNSVDVSPRSLTVDGNFVVSIENRGSPSHLYINTDDDLAPHVSIGNPNLYVEDSEEFEAVVDCDPETPGVEGTLEVTAGYGSETTHVSVSIEPDEDENRVDVDESLSQPQRVHVDDSDDRELLRGGKSDSEDGYRLRTLLAGIGVVILLVAAVVSYAVSVLLDPVSGALVGVVAVVAGGIALYGVSLAYRKTDL